jgi:3-methyl-2-oxobutanoate hydroxymethyltransferase
MKNDGERIVMLTAYDYLTASLVDKSGVDVILVGDSLGMVFSGYSSTIPVTVDEMIYHCRAVSRGACQALVVGDMPFMSFQMGPDEALRNAGRFLKEGLVEAVKLEGGREMAHVISRIVMSGIPVMGHIGLTPQSLHKLGGYGVRGRSQEEASYIMDSAAALAEAGCFALVLEAIPSELAAEVTGSISIPTIGIGAGPETDGQVLVVSDMLGLFEEFKPKFVKRYSNLAEQIKKAVESYSAEVREGKFPDKSHSYE